VPGGVDQTQNFLPTQHRRQPTPILRVGQEIPELMALESLDEKESQGCHTAGRQCRESLCALAIDRLDRCEVRWDRVCRETCQNTWQSPPRPAGNCAW